MSTSGFDDTWFAFISDVDASDVASSAIADVVAVPDKRYHMKITRTKKGKKLQR